MNKVKYSQMIHSQETQHANAWAFIVSSWHTPEWKAIPQGIRNTLNLPVSVGMFSGMLVSKVAADGAMEFVQRLNNRKIQ